jgi:hypothetical protein
VGTETETTAPFSPPAKKRARTVSTPSTRRFELTPKSRKLWSTVEEKALREQADALASAAQGALRSPPPMEGRDIPVARVARLPSPAVASSSSSSPPSASSSSSSSSKAGFRTLAEAWEDRSDSSSDEGLVGVDGDGGGASTSTSTSASASAAGGAGKRAAVSAGGRAGGVGEDDDDDASEEEEEEEEEGAGFAANIVTLEGHIDEVHQRVPGATRQEVRDAVIDSIPDEDPAAVDVTRFVGDVDRAASYLEALRAEKAVREAEQLAARANSLRGRRGAANAANANAVGSAAKRGGKAAAAAKAASPPWQPMSPASLARAAIKERLTIQAARVLDEMRAALQARMAQSGQQQEQQQGAGSTCDVSGCGSGGSSGRGGRPQRARRGAVVDYAAASASPTYTYVKDPVLRYADGGTPITGEMVVSAVAPRGAGGGGGGGGGRGGKSSAAAAAAGATNKRGRLLGRSKNNSKHVDVQWLLGRPGGAGMPGGDADAAAELETMSPSKLVRAAQGAQEGARARQVGGVTADEAARGRATAEKLAQLARERGGGGGAGGAGAGRRGVSTGSKRRR